MDELESNDTLREKLAQDGIYRPRSDSDEYVSPSAGGCWICRTEASGRNPKVMFDTEFDTYYHIMCLRKTGCSSITEFERDY